MMTLVLAALGAKAATFSSEGISGSESGGSYAGDPKIQTLTITTPGALATWIASVTGDNYDANNPFGGLGNDTDFSKLKISGELNANDIAALSSTTCAAFSLFPQIDLSEVTFAEGVDADDIYDLDFSPASFAKGEGDAAETINGSGAEFIRLPNGMASADDVKAMKSLKSTTKNTALKMVGAFDNTNTTLPELALYSFESNKVQNYQAAMIPQSEFGTVKVVRMAGIYGTQDLADGSNVVFNSIPAEWDFTGANFETCSIAGPLEFANNSSYYREDDPFEDDTAISSISNFQTNAFYYFQACAKDVVKLTLPDQITELPPRCLDQLCTANKDNWKLYYGKSDADFAAVALGSDKKGAPLDNLVVPNSVVTVGYECAYNTFIKKISFGSGLKVVQGGAFKQVQGLEDIEFSAGISNCYLGDEAFQLCYDVKHIVLSEGIVSLGAGCFQNSQQMESIRLPETLKYIGNRAFQNNLALASITIPPNVVKIGKGAFVRTPLTDVYLTTTDPNKIPYMYTAGIGWDNNNELDCSFGFDALWGFNTYPQRESDVSGLTWDQAAAYYYANCNCMAVLHYPEQLHDRLWAGFDYSYTSSDNYGLPNMTDGNERGGTGGDLPYYNIADADGKGVYSRDGWAQFVLQKNYEPDSEGEVLTKEYDDVWYTICFPFDLTDEQLAVAFNEGYNIVDFSSIQILDPEDPNTDPSIEKKTLLLHFNKVADTEYRDERERVYVRQLGSNGKPIREKDGDFEYNVYTGPDGETYKHVQVGSNGDKYKTKTFAIDGNSNNPIVMIDGYLASAGHPYMVHPNLGIAFGDPKSRCNFSGIKWLSESERISKYELRKRKIDLGEEKRTDNYNQDDYSGYDGQEYEFVGNWREYNPGKEIPTKPVMPVTKPTPPDKPLSAPTVVADPGPAPANPGNVTLTANEKAIYKRLTKGSDSNTGPWKNETSITADYNDNSPQWSSYNSNAWLIQNLPTDDTDLPELLPYGTDEQKEATFEYCKTLFNRYKKVEIYKSWQTKKAAYDQYVIDQAYYDAWSADNGASLNQQYLEDLAAYNEALDYYNKNDLKTWKENVANMEGFVVIPQNAYFLGRKTGEYPKYYREISNNPKRSTGLWTQFSAIIKPNSTAVNGLEAELDGKTAQAKGYNMAFDEDFFVINDEPHGIATLIEKIEKEEGKADVQYMDIVVSIDGKVISRDKTAIEGLPKGIYIINGKKYFVK